MTPKLAALDLADPPERWESLGFSVRGGACHLVGVRLQLGAAGRGITSWTLDGIPAETREIDGLPTAAAHEPSPATVSDHPNGAVAIDHVVVTSPDFDRTVAALQAVGMPLRRVADRGDGARMGFRRLGPAILELVETSGAPGPGRARSDARGGGRARSDAPGPARFWGLVVVVENLDALADHLGDRLGSIRQAVQPGRRIATLRESAGLGQAVAFMSPDARA